MKKLFIILLLTHSAGALHAQTFAEWFRQDKTQKKYLLQQIAAFQVFAVYVEKGYSIARSGLDAINNIKKGDLTLHSDYFKSLELVNPEIKNDARVAGIVTLDAQIKKITKAALAEAKSTNKLAQSEKVYIAHVLQDLVQSSKADITLLTKIITPGELGLTDDERWRKICELHGDMTEKYSFAKSFAACIKRLIAERSAEGEEIENERNVLGIK